MQNVPIHPARKYDLELRTETFAKNVQMLLEKIPSYREERDKRTQLLRSSGSVAANYIEANEALGKQDFLMRVRICLKEAKESRLWLTLLSLPASQTLLSTERETLRDEAHQLVRIFSTIIRNTQDKWGKERKKPHQI